MLQRLASSFSGLAETADAEITPTFVDLPKDEDGAEVRHDTSTIAHAIAQDRRGYVRHLEGVRPETTVGHVGRALQLATAQYGPSVVTGAEVTVATLLPLAALAANGNYTFTPGNTAEGLAWVGLLVTYVYGLRGLPQIPLPGVFHPDGTTANLPEVASAAWTAAMRSADESALGEFQASRLFLRSVHSFVDGGLVGLGAFFGKTLPIALAVLATSGLEYAQGSQIFFPNISAALNVPGLSSDDVVAWNVTLQSLFAAGFSALISILYAGNTPEVAARRTAFYAGINLGTASPLLGLGARGESVVTSALALVGGSLLVYDGLRKWIGGENTPPPSQSFDDDDKPEAA